MPRSQSSRNAGRGKGKRGKSEGGFFSDAQAAVHAVSRLAPYALRAFKGAASLVNAEFKHADYQTTTALSTTSQVNLISGIAQGDSNLTRDGNSVKVMGLYGDLALVMSASATVNRFRLLIFADTSSQGAAPVAADVIDTSSPEGLINIDTFPNRYLILHDSMHTQVLASETRTLCIRWSLSRDVMNTHLSFSGTAATVGSTSKLTYWLLLLGTEATNTTNTVVNTRLLFVDN